MDNAQGQRNRRAFTITKFGLHEGGYLHAMLTVEGKSYYVDEKYGCWQSPGTIDGKPVRKEVLFPYAEALAAKAKTFRKQKAEEKRHERHGEMLTQCRVCLDLGYEQREIMHALRAKFSINTSQAREIYQEATEQPFGAVA